MMSYLVFTDTETTGLDPVLNEVLSIGIQVCDAATFEVVAEREWYIRPERIETASEKALEVNGYTPEKWTSAGERPGTEVFAEVAEWMTKGVFAGHNCPFDIGFLWEGAKRVGVEFPPLPTEFIDTRHLSQLLHRAKKIPNNKLDSLVTYYGFTRQGFHGALEDADLSRRSAQKIFVQFAGDIYAHVGDGGEAMTKLAALGEAARERAQKAKYGFSIDVEVDGVPVSNEINDAMMASLTPLPETPVVLGDTDFPRTGDGASDVDYAHEKHLEGLEHAPERPVESTQALSNGVDASPPDGE